MAAVEGKLNFERCGLLELMEEDDNRNGAIVGVCEEKMNEERKLFSFLSSSISECRVLLFLGGSYTMHVVSAGDRRQTSWWDP